MRRVPARQLHAIEPRTLYAFPPLLDALAVRTFVVSQDRIVDSEYSRHFGGRAHAFGDFFSGQLYFFVNIRLHLLVEHAPGRLRTIPVSDVKAGDLQKATEVARMLPSSTEVQFTTVRLWSRRRFLCTRLPRAQAVRQVARSAQRKAEHVLVVPHPDPVHRAHPRRDARDAVLHVLRRLRGRHPDDSGRIRARLPGLTQRRLRRR